MVLKTLLLYCFMFVTVLHHPVQVILPIWIPMLMIWFMFLMSDPVLSLKSAVYERVRIKS